MNPRYEKLIERAQQRCEYCHAPAAAFNFPLDVEHITPLAAGGNGTLDNLAIACRSCNVFKAARLQARDPETSALVSLFHPRRDRWEDHFEVESSSLLLHGKTPVGRATLHALQLNSKEQQFARSQWIRLELFP